MNLTTKHGKMGVEDAKSIYAFECQRLEVPPGNQSQHTHSGQAVVRNSDAARAYIGSAPERVPIPSHPEP